MINNYSFFLPNNKKRLTLNMYLLENCNLVKSNYGLIKILYGSQLRFLLKKRLTPN